MDLLAGLLTVLVCGGFLGWRAVLAHRRSEQRYLDMRLDLAAMGSTSAKEALIEHRRLGRELPEAAAGASTSMAVRP